MQRKICFFLIIFSVSRLAAQDIHFSQFHRAPLVQNPAMTGAAYPMQAILNYKEQWKSVDAPFKTFNASFDMRFKNDESSSGFWAGGINLFSDKAGDSQLSTQQGNFCLAYHIKLSGMSTLGAGVTGGFAQRSINYSSLSWGNQFDGYTFQSALSSGEKEQFNSLNYFDLGAGIAWAHDKGEKYMTGNNQVKAEAGLAAFHLNLPKYSFLNDGETLSIKYVAHANMLIGISNSNFSVVPGLMFYKQGSASELLAGSLFRYMLKTNAQYTGFITGSAISLGAHFRTKDSFIASLLLEMGSYSLGISYDLNTSDLKTASDGRGGLELSLRFVNPNPFLK